MARTVTSLRQLLSTPETVQDFAFALDERYWDAMELAIADRSHGSIYLFGFVAEIVLKYAILRVEGARPTAPVAPYSGPWLSAMNVAHPGEPAESRHSIRWLMLLLRLKRQQTSSPLPPPIDRQLVANADLLHTQWKVDLRYRRLFVDPLNFDIAYHAAEWFWENRFHL